MIYLADLDITKVDAIRGLSTRNYLSLLKVKEAVRHREIKQE